MQRLLDFLRLDDIPWRARGNYAAELRHMSLWGVFASLVDGSFSSIVVAKTFGTPLLIPVVWATPMLAHLLTLAWGILVRGRPKVRALIVLALCAVASAGSIALTPSDWRPWGGCLFTVQVGLARIFLSGLVTVRTSIWKANYPHSHRARIAGRIQALQALLTFATGAVISLVFDGHAEYYRAVYPAVALLGVLGLVPLRQMRVLGESRGREAARAAGAPGPAAGGSRGGFRRGLAEAWGILRRDRAFARYCSAQYLLGSANLMTDPILAYFLTQQLGLGYFHSYLLLEQVPIILALVSIRYWAGLFDRVGVLRFRVANSIYWLASIALVTAALLVRALPLAVPALLPMGIFVVGRAVNGLARGGGTIAWNLGHLHFARGRDDDQLYMGIHVALTGLRGLIMPFIGTAVYSLLGPGTLLVAVALGVAALAAFHRLATADMPAPAAAPVTTAELVAPRGPRHVA